MPFDRQLDQFIDDPRKRHSRGRPHFWKARDIGQPRQRVDFVQQQIAVRPQKEIDRGLAILDKVLARQ